jgi:hypothetical protein
MLNIAADGVATSLVRDRMERSEAQRSGLSVSISTLPCGGSTIADIGRRSKSP